MGCVYRVRDLELDEIVALKTLHRMTTGSIAALRQEVKLARRVTHPNVARVFDIGEDGGARFLTIEYVDGTSLAPRLAEGSEAPAEALRIGRAVVEALRAI